MVCLESTNQIGLSAQFIFQLLPTIVIATISVIVYFKNKRKDQITALERNFDVLQRLNETALESKQNLEAAVKSVHADDTVEAPQARIIFFHYLRINRLHRAWEYQQIGVLKKSDMDRIFENYAGTLKSAQFVIGELCERGYPKDFVRDLKDAVEKAKKPPKYSDFIQRMELTADME